GNASGPVSLWPAGINTPGQNVLARWDAQFERIVGRHALSAGIAQEVAVCGRQPDGDDDLGAWRHAGHSPPDADGWRPGDLKKPNINTGNFCACSHRDRRGALLAGRVWIVNRNVETLRRISVLVINWRP